MEALGADPGWSAWAQLSEGVASVCGVPEFQVRRRAFGYRENRGEAGRWQACVGRMGRTVTSMVTQELTVSGDTVGMTMTRSS